MYYGLLLGYRASKTLFLVNVEMPEVGTLPGNSVWTETFYVYLSAVWRQIYIKTSLQMGINASFAQKICLPARIGASFRENFLIYIKLFQNYTKTFLPYEHYVRYAQMLLNHKKWC
jgi:hypothetical protein